jgi:predicted nucleotidyltransferase
VLILLRRLVEHEVRFVLVGGMAAAAYGSSIVTEDIDVCAPLDEANLGRILSALADLHPRQRMRPDRPALPSEPAPLRGFKNLDVVCDAGQIDFLSEITGVGPFEVVSRESVKLDLGGFECAVIGLEGLIRAKHAMGRPKDLPSARELELILAKTRA